MITMVPYKDKFTAAMAFVLAHEGGYVWNPNDPGGETNFGISKKSYPNEDIKNLTREAATEIYRIDYWNPSGAETLDWPLCLLHFDSSVLCGHGAAGQFLDNSGNAPIRYILLRIKYHIDQVNKYPALHEFLLGWMNRCMDLLGYCW